MKSKKSVILQQDSFLLGIQTISLRSRQLVYVLAMCMDKDNPTDYIKIDSKEFMNWINANGKRRWSNLHKLVENVFDDLNANPVFIRKKQPSSRGFDKKDFFKVNWLQECGVSNGQIVAKFSEKAAQYFLFKKGLTYTNTIWDLRGYKSEYAARIIDLFQREHRHHKGDLEFRFEYDFIDLKTFFGVPEKYPRPTDFRKRVLDQARKELERDITAPYYFSHHVVKSGRRVVAIRFDVTIRPDELIRLAPEIELLTLGSGKNQPSLFDSPLKLSDEQHRLIAAVIENSNLEEKYAMNIVSHLSESQSRAFVILLQYGVNHSLAHKIVTKQCSFGELKGYEDHYVNHTLQQVEGARLKRIEEAKSSKSPKRTTPKGKRGGLAKSVFESQQHFPSFMEKLSAIRKGEFERDTGVRRNKREDSPQNLGDVIKKLKAEI